MDREHKEMLIVVAAAAVLVIVLLSSLMIYSGMSRPLTVVESKSMQHSDETSYLGIIDTGDMVIMISPEKKQVTTYVEGYQNGYWKFGSYGDVIIYYRENGKNPVIHRAMIWLDYADGKISAPSLKNYPLSKWSTGEGGSWDDLKEELVLKDVPYKDGVKDVEMKLSYINSSGFLTMGDNNGSFDQMSGIHNNPVMESELKAIAGTEVPWLGCIKLLINHKNVDMIPKNSITCLILLFVDIIITVGVVIITVEYVINVKKGLIKDF